MSISIRSGRSDGVLDRIIEALRGYEVNHPTAEIALYRHDPVSVWIRIIDSDFAGRSKSERSNEVWKYLDALPEVVQSDLSTVILLTPEEIGKSLANIEFEDPVPSIL